MKKQVFNPYLPNYEYIPDGEPRVFGDRLYIYGSHDCFGAPFFCDNDYVLWSTPIDDLSDWTYHGVIYRKDQDPLNRQELNPLFAPDVVEGKDGRYYLYYCPCNTRSIGVAVSDVPEGPFTFLNHVKDEGGELLGRRENDPYPFDPAVLVDEGKIYLYIGFSPDPSWDFMEREFGTLPMSSGPWAVELQDDMCSLKSEPAKVEIVNCPDPGHDFFEAASIRRFDDIYCFIYSSMNSHELCHAISKNPKGPFTYKGILHDNGDIGLVSETKRVSYTGNNHGSLVLIGDTYYIFGHRQTNWSSYARQGVAEVIRRNPDGSFAQAEMTSCGLSGRPLKAQGRYGAYIACHLTGAKGAIHYVDQCDAKTIEEHPAFSQDHEDKECVEGQYIRNMRDGSTAGFKYFEPVKKTRISIRTRGAGGIFQIKTSPKGEVIGAIQLKESDVFRDSEPIEVDLKENGRIALYFTYRGLGSVDFDSFCFH